jgi:hypothetical protein
MQLQLVEELSALPLVGNLEEPEVRQLLLEFENGVDVVVIAKQFNVHPSIVDAYAAKLSPRINTDI